MERNKCSICEKEMTMRSPSRHTRGDAIWHHIRPRQHGGTDYESNILLICSRCHGKLHSFYNKRALEIALKHDERFFENLLDEFVQTR